MTVQDAKMLFALCLYASTALALPIGDVASGKGSVESSLQPTSLAAPDALPHHLQNGTRDEESTVGERIRRDTGNVAAIFEPCGAALADNAIPIDHLPQIIPIIKDLTTGVKSLKDQIATLRIADQDMVNMLSQYHVSILGYPINEYHPTDLQAMLSQPTQSLKSLLADQLSFVRYVMQVVTNEQSFLFSNNLLPELELLYNVLMRTFSCALAQFAHNVSVSVDEDVMNHVLAIETTTPTSKMFASYETYLLFHSLETNFLPVALTFFNTYLDTLTAAGAA